MKLKTTLYSLSIFALIFTLSACTKVEGPGGAASITGLIHVQEYDGAENLINEYDAPKFDVYIIYGDDENETYFDDDIETSFDGSFKFEFLELGTYRIFYYEDCNNAELPTCYSGKKHTIHTVEITDKRQKVDLGTLNVYERF